MSPLRAAGLLLIITVALPLTMVPLLVGGFTNVPPIGIWGGVFVHVLPNVAAGIFWMFTLLLSPLKVVGGTGSPVRPLALIGGARR